MNILDNLQPAVKKETKNITFYTLFGFILMLVVFFVLHLAMPDKVPFDYRVVLGGLGGSIIAILNFGFMALTVQKAAATPESDTAKKTMQASYSRRMLLQMLWVVAAIAAPCFNFVAGIIPLLFPGTGIKIKAILGKYS